MATLPNACAFSVSNTPGTGSGFTIAAVASGPYRIPRAAEDGAEAFVFVREGDTWEICESVYDHATTTWSRGALSDSSGASVARQTFSSACIVSVIGLEAGEVSGLRGLALRRDASGIAQAVQVDGVDWLSLGAEYLATNAGGAFDGALNSYMYVYRSYDTAYTQKYAWWVYVPRGAGCYNAYRVSRWLEINAVTEKAPQMDQMALAYIGNWVAHSSATKTGSGWSSFSASYGHGGNIASSITAGDQILWTEVGHAFGLRAARLQACGYAVVSIDGDWTAANRLATFTADDLTAGRCRAADVGRRYVNFYGITTWADVHIPLADGLSDASHTIVLEVTGTKIESASDVRVRLAGLVAVSAVYAADAPSSSRAFVHMETATCRSAQVLPVCGIETTVAGTAQFVGGVHSGGTDGIETVTEWAFLADNSNAIASLAAGAYLACRNVHSLILSTLATSDAPGTVAANKRQEIVFSAAAQLPCMARTVITMAAQRPLTTAYHGMLVVTNFDTVTGLVANEDWGTLKLGTSIITLRQAAGETGHSRARDAVFISDRGTRSVLAVLEPDVWRDAFTSYGSFVNDQPGFAKAYLNSGDPLLWQPGRVGDVWGSVIGFAMVPHDA